MPARRADALQLPRTLWGVDERAGEHVWAPWRIPRQVHILERDEAVVKPFKISKNQGRLLIYVDGSAEQQMAALKAHSWRAAS